MRDFNLSLGLTLIMHNSGFLLGQLLRVSSPSLPVGGFSYSQGLETAVLNGWVHDELSAYEWIKGVSYTTLRHTDLPLLTRIYLAFREQDFQQVAVWNQRLVSMRETAELRKEELITGAAFRKILQLDGILVSDLRDTLSELSAVACFAIYCAHYRIELKDSLCGYIWSRMENSVAAAIKLVPLGQSAGQKILATLVCEMDSLIDSSFLVTEDELGVSTPASTFASCAHEKEYSRLFRS
ncbi:MAG: urease accessory protein UreF [Gammaproteobacteria bacterium]|nr:urease accessory protein UreF [Gammaproteobacteria bacterium]MDH5694710.1 urease accessory protein UreF [Gammaproteobacteria bacterium]